MKKFLLMALCVPALSNLSWAQTTDKCGYNFIHAAAVKRNPNFDAEHATMRQEAIRNASLTGAKLTTPTAVTVPVVFHIVLDSDYLKLMDPATISDRVNSQIAVLNEDYNKGNADSSKIPGVFKTRYGNPAIRFGLARVDPHGNPTPGWEVIVTTKNGFELNNDDPGANVKHVDSGGADAWDVTKYINVWITNFLVNGSPSTTIGLTIMPSYTVGTGAYPKDEMGIMLRYDAWGRRSSSTENFFANIDQGRTLTHEMGHYFEMVHIWGDDFGKCPNSGGTDDGMADTPPQADATYGCPTFPVTDACSKSVDTGIMFMNYMDYTNDACMYMFTNDQANAMYTEVSPGGESYSLTQHPELLAVSDVPAISTSNLSIYPNPTAGKINLTFTPAPKDLEAISVVNILGQKVWERNINRQQISILNIDLSGTTKGIYFIECQYSKGKEVRKIMLQ